jgi:Arylsulfotransferase (ASST)
MKKPGQELERSSELDRKVTRRRFLQATAGGLALAALGGTLGCDPAPKARATAASSPAGHAWQFRSRPDLRPPVITVTTPPHDTAPGLIFVAPKNGPDEAGPGQDGCVILDNDGQPVWLYLLQDEDLDVMNFKMQTYRGEPVLTWWVGRHTGYGQGEYVILDRSYREVKRFGAGNGYQGDHHEFLITPQDTALITVYHKVPMDTSSVGGSANDTVLDGIAQEIDIETGEVLFEWHSLEHVGLDESYNKPYDYFHINSVDVYDEDHLLISSRNTWTLYKVNRKTGDVVWRFGGKKSDFEMGVGTRTAYQHDARWHGEGTLTVFDNGGGPWVHEQSRAIRVELDEDAMKASLVREYTHPGKLRSATQGSVQILPGGNVFVGWGSSPVISEFSHGGDLLFDAEFPAEGETYRAFRFTWKGYPNYDPAIAAEFRKGDEVKIYASWNGATEFATWRVLDGGPKKLKELASAPKEGFETVITVHTNEPYVGVQALDASGKVLGSSRAIKPEKS